MKVKLDDLEDHPEKYLGKPVVVEGKVEQVLAPTAFALGQPLWPDFGRQVLVYTEGPAAALVKHGDRVVVTGVLTPGADVELERHWSWLRREPEVNLRLRGRPVLVAKAIYDPERKVAVLVDAAGAPAADARPESTDLNALGGANGTGMVGNRVNLPNAKVERLEKNGGFWVSTPDGNQLFVLPSSRDVKVKPGQTVNIQGYVMETPREMQNQMDKGGKKGDEDIYVYATQIK
jgi:hypothetical protein